VAAVVVVAGVAVGVGSGWGRHADGADVIARTPTGTQPAVAPGPATEVARPTVPSWRHVMAALERDRAQAYDRGDLALLATVYAAQSPVGRADLRLLRVMVRRGQHTVGLDAFVESAEVLSVSDSSVTLVVTDALTSYDVLGRDGRVIRHGHGRPSRAWRVTLRRVGTTWRIWSIAASADS
jgi:hypothetical protein